MNYLLSLGRRIFELQCNFSHYPGFITLYTCDYVSWVTQEKYVFMCLWVARFWHQKKVLRKQQLEIQSKFSYVYVWNAARVGLQSTITSPNSTGNFTFGVNFSALDALLGFIVIWNIFVQRLGSSWCNANLEFYRFDADTLWMCTSLDSSQCQLNNTKQL